MCVSDVFALLVHEMKFHPLLTLLYPIELAHCRSKANRLSSRSRSRSLPLAHSIFIPFRFEHLFSLFHSFVYGVTGAHDSCNFMYWKRQMHFLASYARSSAGWHSFRLGFVIAHIAATAAVHIACVFASISVDSCFWRCWTVFFMMHVHRTIHSFIQISVYALLKTPFNSGLHSIV